MGFQLDTGHAKSRQRFGLALAGGGVKGAAHIGVLQALEERGMKPSWISGCSSGSIVAALYAAGYTPAEIKCIFSQYAKPTKKPGCECGQGCSRKAAGLIDIDYFGLAKFLGGALLLKNVNLQGLLKGNRLLNQLETLLAAKGIHSMRDIPLPLAVNALDLNSGQEIYFSNRSFASGVVTDIPAALAVRASCAFPVIFKPLRFGPYVLSDGGILDNLPVSVLPKLGAGFVAGVRFSGENRFDSFAHQNLINIADRSISLLRRNLERYTDRPMQHCFEVPLHNVSLLEMKKLGQCYDAGYQSAVSGVDAMLAKM